METEAVKESVFRGHHVYKTVWTLLIGEELPVFPEPGNVYDKRAVGIWLGHVQSQEKLKPYVATCIRLSHSFPPCSTHF